MQFIHADNFDSHRARPIHRKSQKTGRDIEARVKRSNRCYAEKRRYNLASQERSKENRIKHR